MPPSPPKDGSSSYSQGCLFLSHLQLLPSFLRLILQFPLPPPPHSAFQLSFSFSLLLTNPEDTTRPILAIWIRPEIDLNFRHPISDHVGEIGLFSPPQIYLNPTQLPFTFDSDSTGPLMVGKADLVSGKGGEREGSGMKAFENM